ncbi:MAG TPA: 1,2-phenylacetyl-CoA epoxidase subunit PaaD [Actinomycetota bacterium]|nr:1,2-phenylacetyl-CoA epoxidase subunit PaaD [Actinomycetota bacterium]
MSVTEALTAVTDPEIPSASIVDLGMVHAVTESADAVEVELLPTFVGCPAKYVIGQDVERAVSGAAPGKRVSVRFVYDPPWTADRVNERGRAALRGFGISPDAGTCPYCGSRETDLESAFGPTPCRSTHFCRSCRNVYEGFKDKGRRVLPIVGEAS